MLCIIGQNKETTYELDWHIGEPSHLIHSQVHEVIEIQANGDELEYIKRLFTIRCFKGIINHLV